MTPTQEDYEAEFIHCNERYQELRAAVETLRVFVNNPSAWGAFDQKVSDAIEQVFKTISRPRKTASPPEDTL